MCFEGYLWRLVTRPPRSKSLSSDLATFNVFLASFNFEVSNSWRTSFIVFAYVEDSYGIIVCVKNKNRSFTCLSKIHDWCVTHSGIQNLPDSNWFNIKYTTLIWYTDFDIIERGSSCTGWLPHVLFLQTRVIPINKH